MRPLVLAAFVLVACFANANALGGRRMPAPITFSVSNAKVAHQITLTRDAAPNTIVALMDGIEYYLTDARARKDGKALAGGGFTVIVAQTTVTVSMAGHLRFSGIITDDASRRIIAFVRACGLPPL
jgi:hypothetical protein